MNLFSTKLFNKNPGHRRADNIICITISCENSWYGFSITTDRLWWLDHLDIAKDSVPDLSTASVCSIHFPNGSSYVAGKRHLLHNYACPVSDYIELPI